MAEEPRLTPHVPAIITLPVAVAPVVAYADDIIRGTRSTAVNASVVINFLIKYRTNYLDILTSL